MQTSHSHQLVSLLIFISSVNHLASLTEVKPIFRKYYVTSLPFNTVYFFPFIFLLGVGFLLKYSTAFHC